MAKKFVPTQEQLEQILTRYKETSNYSLVSRETNLSVAIIKRIIQEAEEPSKEAAEKSVSKPKTTAQLLSYNKEYHFTGLPPAETICPKKTVYYGLLAALMQEYLDV